VLLLSPHIPLLYMGEEWGETRPFNFFTDFHNELGDAVREGRRREFAKWPAFADPEIRESIPDPNAESTFHGSKLDWDKLSDPDHRRRFDLVKQLLAVRRDVMAPLIGRIGGNAGKAQEMGDRAFAVTWRLQDGGTVSMLANLGGQSVAIVSPPPGTAVHVHGAGNDEALSSGSLPAGAVVVAVDMPGSLSA
jgi:maltooligosyltrehalose trehalohydrolase